MKKVLFGLFWLVSLVAIAQTDYYTKNGVVVEGYDVTSYFDGRPKMGDRQFAETYDGATFYFASEANRKLFLSDPEKYVPQYGGYCAYAVGLKNKKIKIDPETFEIRDGKLYLFYNAWGTNTLNLWNENDVETLRQKADDNWKNLQH